MTKKAKKIVWAILLMFMLIIGLTLTAVLAASTTKFEIGGIDILTASNYTVPCGEGTAVYDPEQNTLTLNHATIEYSSGNMAGIYTTKEELTIILNGENKITSVCFGIFGGKTLKMQGDGMLTVESAKDSVYADDITMDNITVNLTSQESIAVFASKQIKIENGSNVTATAKTTAIQGNTDVQISKSSIHAISTDGKALYSDGTIGIENHSQVMVTGNHNTVWGDTDVEIYDSKVDITATDSGMAIYSNQGDTTIERSFVKVTAPDDYTIVSGNYLYIRDSWLESFNGAIDNMPNWTIWENIVSFQDKVGTAIGDLSIPENVEVSKDMVLTIPDGASVTVPAGKTFTNHGTINLLGTFTKEDAGTVICDSHTGGESTCTQAGKCAICGQEYGGSLYHSWNDPTWAWSEDGKTCQAVFTCSRCGVSQKEKAEVSAKETTPATCMQKGTTTYTATVEFEGKKYTDNKSITDIPAFGHQYGEPKWEWSEDGKTSTAVFTCGGCEDSQEVAAEVSAKETTPATCTQKGTTTYTATVEFEGKKYTGNKSITDIAALGHQYGEPKWEWSEDGKTSTAVFTCSRCEDSQEVAAEVSAKETTPATCTQEGTTAYTAKVEFAGKKYMESKEITDIPALGHHYENGKCTVCGDADPNYKPEAPIIISGADAVWEKDSKDPVIFTSNAEFSTFRNVLVDGKELDEKDYDIKEGSTVVTLKLEYLSTLAIGKHTLAIVSENGTAQTTFTITANSVTQSTSSDPEKEPESSQTDSEPEREPESSQISSKLEDSQTSSGSEKKPENSQTSVSPEKESANSDTGTNNHIMLWIAILLVSGMGVAGVGIYSKDKRKEKHL